MSRKQWWGGIPGYLSSLFSEMSFINHSHSLYSQTFNTLGVFLILRPLLSVTSTWELARALEYRSSSMIPCRRWRSRQGSCRERCSEQLPFLSPSHRLFADSFLACEISGIHLFQMMNSNDSCKHLCRNRVLGNSASKGFILINHG